MLLVPLLGSGLGLAACGDDSGDEADAVDRYCAAVAAAEQRGEELFSGVDESDEDALVAAERAMLEFVRDNFPDGADLPEEIRTDFGVFMTGLEGQADVGFEPTAEQQAAEERLLAWEAEHCPSD